MTKTPLRVKGSAPFLLLDFRPAPSIDILLHGEAALHRKDLSFHSNCALALLESPKIQGPHIFVEGFLLLWASLCIFCNADNNGRHLYIFNVQTFVVKVA